MAEVQLCISHLGRVWVSCEAVEKGWREPLGCSASCPGLFLVAMVVAMTTKGWVSRGSNCARQDNGDGE